MIDSRDLFSRGVQCAVPARFKARAPAHAPPQLGWAALVAAEPPQLVATFREL